MVSRIKNNDNTVGSYLVSEVLEPLGLSVTELADGIKVPANRLYQIINGDRELTTDTAVRLGHFFGTGPEMWLYLQMKSDLTRFHNHFPDVLDSIGRFSA
ncbi:MAG: HigA family addiction module antitoxin [bacterium]|nr:HigA family addiction module antitoxin [bacterium]